MSNVVIVESPAKAKTINKYLGTDFTVLASYGHIRDLPSKEGSVLPDADFDMKWEVGERSHKQIKEIAAAVKKADHLFLATDQTVRAKPYPGTYRKFSTKKTFWMALKLNGLSSTK